MRWIYDYQLFLFDFDGLLVNTEELQYQAYIRMCANRGFTLTWDFHRYCHAAHHLAEGLRDQIYAEFPALQAQEPNWSVLHTEKKNAFVQLIQEGPVHLMPGVAELLEALQKADIKRCVVTHSTKELIDIIRQKNSILDTIPNWITRQDYTTPKPNPECYLTAIAKFAKPDDQIIGFEDAPRGLNALRMTRALPILICSNDYPGLKAIDKAGILHFPSLEAVLREEIL